MVCKGRRKVAGEGPRHRQQGRGRHGEGPWGQTQKAGRHGKLQRGNMGQLQPNRKYKVEGWAGKGNGVVEQGKCGVVEHKYRHGVRHGGNGGGRVGEGWQGEGREPTLQEGQRVVGENQSQRWQAKVGWIQSQANKQKEPPKQRHGVNECQQGGKEREEEGRARNRARVMCNCVVHVVEGQDTGGGTNQGSMG